MLSRKCLKKWPLECGQHRDSSTAICIWRQYRSHLKSSLIKGFLEGLVLNWTIRHRKDIAEMK